MNYRILGKTNLRVSALGFGCMRLPMKDDKVDDALAIPLLRKAVELGVTYFDSAVFYCNADSQRAVGDALHDLRDRIVLSTKNSEYRNLDTWHMNLETSLKLMRTDFIDLYHFHGLSWEKYESSLLRGGFLDAMLKAHDQGLVRHIAYSCHDTPENNIRLAETGLFESCLMQYNLLNRANAPVISRLSELGLGVVIMGPVGGGRLANVNTDPAAPADNERTSAQLAMKWVLSNPGVHIALSGMSSMEMLEDNVAVTSEELALSESEQIEVASSEVRHEGLLEIYCTSCGYCMPCPAGVNIPENFTLAHLDQAYGMSELAGKNYEKLPGKARYCTECGKCLDLCPQKLDIPGNMRRVVDRLDPEIGKPALDVALKSAQPKDGGVEFHFVVVASNLSEEPITGQVALDLAGQMILQKDVSLKGRKNRRFDIKHVANPEDIQGTVRYRGALESAAGNAEVLGDYPLVLAHRVSDGSLLHPDQIFVCGPKKLVLGDAALLPLHRFGFRVAHNGENLLVVAEVDEDHLSPNDGLDLFFDCRSEEDMRDGPYVDGVAHVRLMPADPPRLEEINVKGVSFEGSRVTVSSHKSGYHLRARIPLASFPIAKGQKIIGFDVHQYSFGENGKKHLQLAWAGNKQSDRMTAGFGLMYLQ